MGTDQSDMTIHCMETGAMCMTNEKSRSPFDQSIYVYAIASTHGKQDQFLMASKYWAAKLEACSQHPRSPKGRIPQPGVLALFQSPPKRCILQLSVMLARELVDVISRCWNEIPLENPVLRGLQRCHKTFLSRKVHIPSLLRVSAAEM